MSKQISREQHDRLIEIQEEMKSLLREAEWIVHAGGEHSYARAKAYWLGYMEGALGEQDSGMMCSMGKGIIIYFPRVKFQ